MGCSPSKDKLFTGIYNHHNNTLLLGSCENNRDHISGGTQIKSQTETEIGSGGQTSLQEEIPPVQLQGNRPTVCDTISENVDMQETHLQSQEELQTEESKDIKDDRIMKNNGCGQRERLRNAGYIQSNSDLPQAIVKAHGAAYDYVTQNIPKYESVLGLLEKATRTELSLQSMVTLLTLQYEEINQVLDEIANEGEQMLEINGNQVALPAAQNDVPLEPDIPEAERNLTESSPDLLQHMLHDLVKKMRFLVDSVKELGDTSLKETSECFGSLSQLLAEKLGTKSAVELRLNQVLACVESYAIRKLDSENCTLHSEDSGIGGENECHNNVVRQCKHQESPGSGTNTQSLHGLSESSSLHQACINVDEDDIDKDIDAENSNDEEPKHEQRDLTDKKMSNWSQEDASQYALQGTLKNNKKSTNNTFEWSNQKDQDFRRPRTSDDLSVSGRRKHKPIHLRGAQRSRSADCLCRIVNDDMVQGKSRLPNDNQNAEWITKRQNPSQFYCLKDGNIEPFKPGLTPSLNLAFVPVPPGKNAVKRLINTFSQGVCDSSNQKPPTGASRFRGRKKSFLPVINNHRVGVLSNGNINTNSYPLDHQCSVKPCDVDVNSFPPPPPELLMDSYGKNEGHTSDEYASKSFYDARSVFCQEYQSASQSVKPSCRSTLPRPWGESKISRQRLQTHPRPFRPTLTDHQLLSSVTEPHYQDSESTTLNNGK